MSDKKKYARYFNGVAVRRQNGIFVKNKKVVKGKHPLVTLQTLPFVFLGAAGLATIVWLFVNGFLK